MRIKTEYGEFVYKIEDAEFTLKEADISQYSNDALSIDSNNEIKFDAITTVLNNLIKDCIISWKGVFNEKAEELKCTDENKLLLRIDTKLEILNAIQEKSKLPEKKSKS